MSFIPVSKVLPVHHVNPPSDYPVLLMHQLKRRKVKEGTGERFMFKKGGLLCGDQK